MMNQVAIVTDSSTCIPVDLVQKYGIHVIPFRLYLDGIELRDGVDISPDEIYSRMEEKGWKSLISSGGASTAGGSVDDFLATFSSLANRVKGIVVILLTSELSSATWNAAFMAKQQVSHIPIEIVDSHLVTSGEGLVALRAVRVAQAGASLPEVVRIIKDTIPKVHCFYTLENLKYVRYCGRVNLPSYAVASMLNINPIFTLKDGNPKPIGITRSRKRAISHLLKLMKERTTSSPLHLALTHANAPSEVEELRQQIESSFNCEEMLITRFTPVMGIYCGPSTIGVTFYNE
jgi:DegV family protein with EDD domain